MFTDFYSVEVQEEELNDMLHIHTVSEQATGTLHSDDFLETFSVSQPIVFIDQVYPEVNIEEEEVNDRLFSQTISEQPTVTLHQENFSVPLILQQPVYHQLNFDEFCEELQNLQDFTSNPDAAS